jgi:hypothetical protein
MSEVLEMLATELNNQRVQEIANYLGATPEQTEAAIVAALPTLVAAIGKTTESEPGAERVALQMQAFGGGSLGDLLGGILSGGKKHNMPRSDTVPPFNNPPGGRNRDLADPIDEILPPGFETNANSPDVNPRRPSPWPEPTPTSTRKESPLDRSLGPGNELPPSMYPNPSGSPAPSSKPLNPDSMGDVLDSVLGNKKKRVEDAIGKSSGLDLKKIGPLLMILAPLVLSAMRARASSKSSSGSTLNPRDLSEMMRGERASVESRPGGSIIGKMLDQDGDGDFDLSDILKLGMRFLFPKR